MDHIIDKALTSPHTAHFFSLLTIIFRLKSGVEIWLNGSAESPLLYDRVSATFTQPLLSSSSILHLFFFIISPTHFLFVFGTRPDAQMSSIFFFKWYPHVFNICPHEVASPIMSSFLKIIDVCTLLLTDLGWYRYVRVWFRWRAWWLS